MKKLSFILTTALLLTMFSCGKRSRVLPESSGKANEVLLVVDDAIWKSVVGDSIKAMFTQEVAGIPWIEPLFDISRVGHDGFSDMLKPARNIVEFDVSGNYSAPKITFTTELFSRMQVYIKIQVPNGEVLKQVLKSDGNKILSFIYKAEKERIVNTYTKFAGQNMMKKVQDSAGIKMLIPEQFTRTKFAKNFIWLGAGNFDASQYLVIYSTPYTSAGIFTKENMIAMRDSVMKTNMPGENDGSYMSTVVVYSPEFKEVTVRGKYCAELRGLWETKGDMMGGPFVSRSFVDEVTQRVITVEGFVYAPQLDKRNMMRQLEAYISTAKLPADTIADDSIFMAKEN